jgi:hypothetical protein
MLAGSESVVNIIRHSFSYSSKDKREKNIQNNPLTPQVFQGFQSSLNNVLNSVYSMYKVFKCKPFRTLTYKYITIYIWNMVFNYAS